MIVLFMRHACPGAAALSRPAPIVQRLPLWCFGAALGHLGRAVVMLCVGPVQLRARLISCNAVCLSPCLFRRDDVTRYQRAPLWPGRVIGLGVTRSTHG